MRIPRSEVTDYLKTKHGIQVDLTDQGKVQRVVGPLLKKLMREEAKERDIAWGRDGYAEEELRRDAERQEEERDAE